MLDRKTRRLAPIITLIHVKHSYPIRTDSPTFRSCLGRVETYRTMHLCVTMVVLQTMVTIVLTLYYCCKHIGTVGLLLAAERIPIGIILISHLYYCEHQTFNLIKTSCTFGTLKRFCTVMSLQCV